MRWAWVEVDLAAIEHNVAHVRARVAPAALWAVVKANAYGHGAVPVANAALAAGATGLCVALVQEGEELRGAGIDAPVLLLGEQPPEELARLVEDGLIATVYSSAGVDELADAAAHSRIAQPIHVKVDTGMHRAGVAPDDVGRLLDHIAARPALALQGMYTHFAMADDPGATANDRQLQRFQRVLATVDTSGLTIHAANSAAALTMPAARHDLVRLGIAMYGIVPGSGVREACEALRPALSLHARVGSVRRVSAGEGVSYGLRYVLDRESTIATIPIGYADGVPRRLFEMGGEVLLHGRRTPIVGVVTMDSVMVDCGDREVTVGDAVVLIGRQAGREGEGEITAEEWADRLGTIPYEIVCGLGPRVPRVYRSSRTEALA